MFVFSTLGKEPLETEQVEEQVESDSETGYVEANEQHENSLGTTEGNNVPVPVSPIESLTSPEILNSEEPDSNVASLRAEQSQEQVTPDVSAEVQQSLEHGTPTHGVDLGNSVEGDASDTVADPGEDEAAKKYSKKNRNIKKVLITAKNKIETFQENNGGQANYLLLIEDNCTELPASGPRTMTNRKVIVSAGGEMRELFKTRRLFYDPEKMIMLKKGKTLAKDHDFFEEYIAARCAVAENVPLQSTPLQLHSTPLQPLPVPYLPSSSGIQSCCCSNKRKRSSRKRKSRVFESSEYDSESTDSSEEIRYKRRKLSKKKGKRLESDKTNKGKKNKIIPSHDIIESEESDNFEESVDSEDSEYDNDSQHGTSQESKRNKKIRKAAAQRHAKERKTKHDLLKNTAVKVHTPGSFPVAKKPAAKPKGATKGASKDSTTKDVIKAKVVTKPAATKRKAPEGLAKPLSKPAVTKPSVLKVKAKVVSKPAVTKPKTPEVSEKPVSKPVATKPSVQKVQEKIVSKPAQTKQNAPKVQAKPSTSKDFPKPKDHKTMNSSDVANTDANRNATKQDQARQLSPFSKLLYPDDVTDHSISEEGLEDDHNKENEPFLQSTLPPAKKVTGWLDQQMQMIPPGPSGQFKPGQFKPGRSSNILDKSKKVLNEKSQPVARKVLFKEKLTTNEIEKQLAQVAPKVADRDVTPIRKRKK